MDADCVIASVTICRVLVDEGGAVLRCAVLSGVGVVTGDDDADALMGDCVACDPCETRVGCVVGAEVEPLLWLTVSAQRLLSPIESICVLGTTSESKLRNCSQLKSDVIPPPLCRLLKNIKNIDLLKYYCIICNG